MTGADAAPPSIEIVRGTPTDEELAALVAVVGEAYAAESAVAPASAAPRSRWQLSARPLRRPLQRELGWRAFTG